MVSACGTKLQVGMRVMLRLGKNQDGFARLTVSQNPADGWRDKQLGVSKFAKEREPRSLQEFCKDVEVQLIQRGWRDTGTPGRHLHNPPS